jgi:hypothetical protein
MVKKYIFILDKNKTENPLKSSFTVNNLVCINHTFIMEMQNSKIHSFTGKSEI